MAVKSAGRSATAPRHPILILSARGEEKDKVAALGSGRRRLRDEAVRARGAHGPGPRRASAFAWPREAPARSADARRSDDRLRSEARAPRRGRNQTHAERIRATDAAGDPCWPRLDAPTILRRSGGPTARSAGTPPRADGSASEEDRAGPGASPLPADRTLGRLSLRGRARRRVRGQDVTGPDYYGPLTTFFGRLSRVLLISELWKNRTTLNTSPRRFLMQAIGDPQFTSSAQRSRPRTKP